MADILTAAALDTFRRVLDPKDNSTGGGSASAIGGAMAASLAAMVARLSIRPDASEPESFYREIAAAGAALSGELLAGSHEDAAAFDAVVAAYRLPKASDEEVAVRREAIQSAFVTATRVPLANARRCAAVLNLVTDLQGRSNERAKSDLICAWRLGEAALQGCLANVEINLPGIKDQAVRGAIAAEMEALAAAALQGDAK